MNELRWAVLLGLVMVCARVEAQFPRSVTEPGAVANGATIFARDCASCHGGDARGSETAPDLLRSTMVLHDRRENLRGKELGPYLGTIAPHKFAYSETEVNELSQFLSAEVNKILRSGYDSQPKDLLSGDAKAGEAYFQGEGGCAKCHSTTGDLAGIGKRYSAVALQQRFLFPQAVLGKKAAAKATVKLSDGSVVTGDVVRIDDFTVTLRDAKDALRSINRGPGVQVSTTDPYAGHVELLDKITDADIHNLTTYLDTLR
jgi:cytochrome c oxidase cbb3-type subunit 3